MELMQAYMKLTKSDVQTEYAFFRASLDYDVRKVS